jgi:hypothetical protein
MKKPERALFPRFTGAGLIASARGMSLFALVVSCAAAGCKDEEILQACYQLCQARIACAEENEETPPNQTGCETACLGAKGNDFVARAKECEQETSCDFVACADP